MRIPRALLLVALFAGGCSPLVGHAADGHHDMAMPGSGGNGGDDMAGGGGSGGGGGGGGICPTGCSVGAKSCDGNGVRTCNDDGHGCGVWSSPQACQPGQVCSGGQCQASCVSQCMQGATYCSGAGYRTCIQTISGCNDWSPTVSACPNGMVCSGGACTGACTDRCAPGANQCSGSGVQTCEVKPSGCRDWSDPIPCGNGKVCSGGNCVTSCTNQCAQGDKRCMGTDSLQKCDVQASGCTDWSLAQLCPGGGSCTGNMCVTCTNGSKRCGATMDVEQCINGAWTQISSCAFGCSMGGCVNTVNCTPGAYRCNGNAVEICNSAGSAWLWSSNCAVSCSMGLCTGGCTPGAKRCNGTNVETCDATGTTWNQTAMCGASGCDGPSSSCILPSLTISTDTTMDGLVVVAGAVEVMANAKLITNQGLTIRAKTITVDQGGTILANPMSATTPGDATNASNYGGSGGSYASAGGCGYYCYVGSAFGSATDSDVSPGGRGGAGYGPAAGGLGGGVLRLIASQSITINGRVSADGASGIVNGSYAGGSGAGGGILFAADNITVAGTGIVSAAGGPQVTTSYTYGYGGAGGQGRVKILYGSSVATNGSITGTVTKGLLPPLTITSTTHPSPSLTYNDAFNAVALSWNQPYANRLGYYVLFDRNASNPPTTTNGGMFQANELLSIDPSKLSSGANYFHIVTEDNMSNIGGVESVFRININVNPPALTSSTHTPGTWSTNRNPYYTWTMPTADSNYQGVRYVLDHYANTAPTSATGTFIPTTQQKLQLSNLDDGIWVLHMVTVDQQGYQTKNVAHYQAWIAATSPGNGTLNGQISWINMGTAQTIAGATVTVNRGLFTSTATASDGKYNLPTVPAGTWELTATAPGFMPAVKMVTVTASMPTTTDFQLTKLP